MKSKLQNEIRLKKIDLSQGSEHSHPDIVVDKTSYLVRIDKIWFAGTFSKVWFGLHFNGWYDVGIQYDKPGTNRSRWKEVYEIVRICKRKREEK